MALSLLLAMLSPQDGALQEQTTAPTPVVVTPAFERPFTAMEPVRLALTPTLDGKIVVEEWDPVAVDDANAKGFLQWEPGKLHLAATVPNGTEAVFSLDLNNDGWLRGSDNLEVRLRYTDKAEMSARWLDATGKEGPVWKPEPLFALTSKVAGSTSTDSTQPGDSTLEATLIDPGRLNLRARDGQKIGFRFDVSAGVDAQAFLPRTLTEITLATMRFAALPSGLKANIQDGFPTVVPGENTRLRFTFNGDSSLQLQRLELRSEGAARPYTAYFSLPFPTFDNKGRAFVDYGTKIDSQAPLGYRIVQALVVGSDNVPGIVQGSYRIAPLVDFILRTDTVKTSPASQRVKVKYGVRSNSTGRVLGGVAVGLPEGWRNYTEDKGYVIGRKGWIADREMLLEIPGGALGTYPITFRSVLGDKITEDTVYLTITE